MRSTESIQGVVFDFKEDAIKFGKGGMWYSWKENSACNFPQDVSSLFIVMPVNWGDPNISQHGIPLEWTIDRENDLKGQWELSGTKYYPTLSPSLHWVDMWHGWLSNGYLHSC